MKRNVVVAGVCLALLGCANQHVYVKDGTDVEKHDVDLMACKSKMSSYGSRDEAQDVLDKCMAEKGYDKRISKYGM